jgi:recombination protein RecA
MPANALIRLQIESKLPGALRPYQRSVTQRFATGITVLDRRLGGIPQSTITEICTQRAGILRGSGTKQKEIHKKGTTSFGKTAILFSLLAQLTRDGHFCAMVDGSDCFDPASAEAAGVDFSRLLWVRCGAKHRLKSLEQAFKAADILLQNGGFGLIAVDLGNIEERQLRKIPLTTWFRFARVVEKRPIALVFLTPGPVAQSCAGLRLEMRPATPRWSAAGQVDAQPLGLSLAEMEFEIEAVETRLRKPVQSAQSRFTAAPVWA